MTTPAAETRPARSAALCRMAALLRKAAPWTIALAMLAGTGLQPDRAASQPADLPAAVTTLAGSAELLSHGATAWVPARLRAELDAGGAVRTPGIGRMALRTASGHALRLGSFTQLQVIGAAPGGSEGPLRVKLLAGRLWVAVSPVAGPRPRVEVEAGPVTVSVRGSGVSLRTERDGSVLVRVYHGFAVATGAGGDRWERPLKGGQELKVAAGVPPADPGALTRENEETLWVRWNEEQDAAGYGGPPPK